MAVRVPAKKAAAASPRRHGTGQSNRREEPIAPTVLESWGHAPPQIVAPLSNRTKAPDASDPILANQEEHVLPLKAKNAREVSALQLLLKNGKRSSSAVGSARSPHQKEATGGDDQVERTQRQQENELRGSRDPTTKIRVDRTTSGHAAYVAEVLRQFFRARPRQVCGSTRSGTTSCRSHSRLVRAAVQVVIDTFRGSDANFNGRIERQEFLKTLKSLNLNLADKDFDALFRATDIDHSGTIEIDEFLNLLRVDALISSEPFFWHEARPHRLLTKKERLEMARELTQADRGEGVKMAPEEIMRLFQTRVSQRSMKSVYQLMDEDRSGAVETNEIVESLQRLRIHVTEEEARDLMESINKKLEPNNASRDKVAYSSFAAALQLDSMVRSELEAREKKDHVTCPDKVEEGWEDRQLKRTRNIHKHLIGGGERHDGALDVAEDAENHQYMPAGSRELHGDSMLFSGNGLDWFKTVAPRTKEEHLLGSSKSPRSTGLGGFRSDRSVQIGNAASTRFEASSKQSQQPLFPHPDAQKQAAYAPRTLRPLIRSQRAHGGDFLDPTGAREAFHSVPGSPGFVSEAERLATTTRTGAWTASHDEQDRRQRRLGSMSVRMAEINSKLSARQQAEELNIARRNEAKRQLAARHRRLTLDRQQVIDSRFADQGKAPVVLEPAACAAWNDAPPHMGSHWHTISKRHCDPAERQPIKRTTNCRRSFHLQEEMDRMKKLDLSTPRIVWGGVHAPEAATPT